MPDSPDAQAQTGPLEAVVLRTTGRTYFSQPVVIECDGDCLHAWGTNWRDEKGATAPEDPGTYEGGQGKPLPPYPPEEHNKWCARECERSRMIPA